MSHDAAVSVISDGSVVFAAHSERYSRVKNDPMIHPELIREATTFGRPDRITWYERPILKKLRHARAGQWREACSLGDLPSRYLRSLGLPVVDLAYVSHHDSHLAAAYATMPSPSAAYLIADAIGEMHTFSVGVIDESGMRCLAKISYPHSLGLLYSAFTRRCGFRPNEDEYIVMGMAPFGEPRHVDAIYDDLIEPRPLGFRLRRNVHRGIGDWYPDARREDLAASVQTVTEEVMVRTASELRRISKAETLILGGGVALNCVANSRVARESGFRNIWIFPNPGDAGSSLGAAAVVEGGKLRWGGPYLGTEIAGEYPVQRALAGLKTDGVVALASGRAEFGPRALGNRSLLADPRVSATRDRVNTVKAREKFRPFAPVIREEILHDWFDLPVASSPYMQFTATCRDPTAMPAVVHVDNTSRVQSVNKTQHPGLHALLGEWEDQTGCPVLLNTSLNSRSEPLVNTLDEARQFARRESIPLA